ncbi:MAG TPA: TIGR01777 family oxidoreductase [Candidatus Binatia bacterium]|jgi:hypothetical protein
MELVITGASGFIGTALTSRLLTEGHRLKLLTHSAPRTGSTENKRWHHWTPGTPGDWHALVDGADGIINLAGEPIAAKRWTQSQKKKIRESRIAATRSLVEAIAAVEQKPAFLLNASAVGYYGPRGDEIITEETPPGNDFLSSVCREWEDEARQAERFGVRVIRLRTGIVLGRGGGALAKMVLPFKLFAGGPLGSGNQWMPWIHLEDEIGLIVFLIQAAAASGAFNAAAPNPERMKDFCRTLGQVMGRPSWLGAPAVALKLALGEMSGMLLTGQRAVPAAAERLHYAFKYPALNEALRACMPL